MTCRNCTGQMLLGASCRRGAKRGYVCPGCRAVGIWYEGNRVLWNPILQPTKFDRRLLALKERLEALREAT